MDYGLLGGLFLAVAVAPIAIGARLFRRGPLSSLPAYLPYLALWNFHAVFSTAFFLYIRYLPTTGQMGFLLFNGILLIPVHAATVIFYADFLWTRLGRRLSWAAKSALAIPFVVVLATYARRAILRLIADPAPSSFDVASPASMKIMVLALVVISLAGVLIVGTRKDELRKKRVIPFAGLTVAGLALFLILSSWPFSDFASYILSGFTWLAMNIPAFIFLVIDAGRERTASSRRWFQASRLEEIGERYGLSEREREILALACWGRLNREIARELHISLDTVKKHLYNVFKKTGVRSRVQLFLLVSGEEFRLPHEQLKET
jgi:DNA-binding CsgD family transcriptional regulator